MKLSDHLAQLSSILNAYMFECSKSRFYEQVKQGYGKDTVIENLIDQEGGETPVVAKFDEFLKAQMKSMELKMSTQEKIHERFLYEKWSGPLSEVPVNKVRELIAKLVEQFKLHIEEKTWLIEVFWKTP